MWKLGKVFGWIKDLNVRNKSILIKEIMGEYIMSLKLKNFLKDKKILLEKGKDDLSRLKFKTSAWWNTK